MTEETSPACECRQDVEAGTAEPPAITSDRRADGLSTLTAGVELARIELRRGYRWLRGQDFWLLYMAVSALGLLFGSWVAFDVSRSIGTALATGESPPLSLAAVGIAWSVLWLFLTATLAVDALGSNGDLANDGHYLTIRPAADVVVGKLLAAAAKFAVLVFVLPLATTLGLAVGVGTPLPLVGGLAATVVVTLTATAIGYPIGLATKGVIHRSERLFRLKPVLGVGIGVGYMIVMISGEFTTVIEWITPVLQAPPLAWLGDLALSTTVGVGASGVGAIGALGVAGVAVVAGTRSTVVAARYAWSADRARPTEDDADDAAVAPDHRIDRLLRPVCQRPAALSIASTTLVRAYRSPLQLVFVAFPLVAAIPLGESLLATGTLPWYAPWAVVWYGAWAAGAAVPLNPLGNQGATLPTLLSAPAGGRSVVHGHVVAVLPITLVIAGLAVGVGVLAGESGTALAVLAVASVVAIVAAAVLAAGIGAVFPRFAAVDFAGARRAVPPSKVAYGVFSQALTLAVVAGAVVVDDSVRELSAVVLSAWLPFGLTMGVDTLMTGSWIVLGCVAVAVPIAYRVAVRRVNDYRLA
ncbi:hypothetical protein [Halococcus saccharolyticus]|uniref:ABC-2 type transport system permease protein n=1 Tax=Halococcus saccharolyticus DSM 5350 TaxID=1227455 RepID=M0MLI7_9EURY|nr:hypothetical protein [Halococcus saccharolyticus]EMA45320.1 hypothetical protein C449_06835 [Halococcus saccharolyticus DSM 5350]